MIFSGFCFYLQENCANILSFNKRTCIFCALSIYIFELQIRKFLFSLLILVFLLTVAYSADRMNGVNETGETVS